jgi:hypothetical protein
MVMDALAAFGVGYLFFMLLVVLIIISILRWVLRINHIIARLDKIAGRLDDIVNNGIEVEIASSEDGKAKPVKPEKPKTFIEGLRKGMED